MKSFKVTINGAPAAKIAARTALFDLIDAEEPQNDKTVAAYIDNKITELSDTISADCSVRFINILSPEGLRIYERSLIIMLVKAAKELFPSRRVIIRHSVRFDIFFEMIGDSETLPEEVAALEKRMRELVARRIPFKRVEIPIDEAETLFKEKERQDLYNAIRERHRPYVVFY